MTTELLQLAISVQTSALIAVVGYIGKKALEADTRSRINSNIIEEVRDD